MPENYITQLPIWLCSEWTDRKQKGSRTVARSGLTVFDVSNQKCAKLAAWMAAISMIQATGGWTSVSKDLSRNALSSNRARVDLVHDHSLTKAPTIHVSVLPLTLRELSMARVGLRRLPKALQTLRALEFLDLGYNRRLDVSDDDWIGYLPALKRLSIAHTAAMVVPKWMQHTVLSDIDLSNSYPSDFEHEHDFLQPLGSYALCESVMALELGGVTQMRDLPIVLRGLVHLKHLDLSGWCCLERLPEWLGDLPIEFLGLSLCLELVSLPRSFEYARKPDTKLQLIDVRDCYALHGFTGLDDLDSTWPCQHVFSSLCQAQPQLIFRIGESQWLTDRDVVVSPTVPVGLALTRRMK